jgi:NADH-quinone oxidoreductase subunit N
MSAIIISALLGVVMMFAGLLTKKSTTIQWVAILGSILLAGATMYDFTTSSSQSLFNGMLICDSDSNWFNIIITFCLLVYIFIFHHAIAKIGRHDAEYFALIFFIMCGVYILSSYNNLLTLFLGIEILSIPQYILAGSDKRNLKSNEASLKYFLMGAFSTGILLMGITLIYGATGSFNISSNEFTQAFTSGQISSIAVLGILLLVIAFAFKVSAAPMHLWTPDVYDGAPTPVTPFMATIVKVSVFIAFIKLFHLGFGDVQNEWKIIVAAIIVCTLLVGNITAVYQQSVKRMLAYSSIAQAGFMLFTIFAINKMAFNGLTLYAVTYTLATCGVFALLLYVKDYTIDGFNGLAKKEPVLAATGTICLLSLAGTPLTGGFFAKYYVLNAVMQQGSMIWLIVFAVLMAAVSVYYYFKVIQSMYFKDGEATTLHIVTPVQKALLIINAIIIILLGIIPSIAMR